MTGSAADVPEGLASLLRDMLEPDGYAAVILEWPSDGAGRVRIGITAQEDACGDCLVPKPIMQAVLAKQLPDGIDAEDLELVYPGDVAGASGS